MDGGGKKDLEFEVDLMSDLYQIPPGLGKAGGQTDGSYNVCN